MKRFLFISLTLLLISNTIADAQESTGKKVWTLGECIRYAKENNLDVRRGILNIERAQNNLRESKLSFLPDIDASITHDMSWKRVSGSERSIFNHNKRSMSTGVELSSTVDLFDGLSRVNALKSERAELQIAEQQVDRLKNKISIQITKAYLQVLLSKEIARCAEESYKSTIEQLARTERFVEEGSSAFSTLLEVKAQMAKEKSELVDATGDVRSNTLSLMQLLDLPDDQMELFEVTPPDTSSAIMLLPQESVDEIYAEALTLPRIRELELELQKSRYNYKITYGKMFPELSLEGEYSSSFADERGSGAFFSQFDRNRIPVIELTLSIPIFSGLSAKTALKNSRIAIEESKIELESAQQELYKDIQSAYNEAFSAGEKMKAAEENMKSSRESFSYTENKFNVGMTTATEYNVAKTDLYKAESSYYQAKYQYLFELKILDFYRGKELGM